MRNQPTEHDAAMTGLLDRLVCGELEEAPRRQLLAWLEEDPRRWRICGLAFLEAQTWSQALGERPTAVAEVARLQARTLASPATQHSVLSTQYSVPSTHCPVASADAFRGRRRMSLSVVAIAACLLLAFTLGFSLHAAMSPVPLAKEPANGVRQIHQAAKPVLAALNVDAGQAISSQVHVPVVPSNLPSESRDEEIPEYVRQQWQRQGFKLSVERRYLFAKLPDGQQVVVPVEQILVDHSPKKVY